MPWQARYAIGIRALDLDHQLLCQTLDTLLEALRSGGSARVVEDTIEVLRAYATEHFRREEEVMRAVRYPELAAHVAEHDAFRRKALELDLARRQSTLAASEVVRYLIEWLPSHIGGADAQIVPYVRSHLAKNPGAFAPRPVERSNTLPRPEPAPDDPSHPRDAPPKH